MRSFSDRIIIILDAAVGVCQQKTAAEASLLYVSCLPRHLPNGQQIVPEGGEKVKSRVVAVSADGRVVPRGTEENEEEYVHPLTGTLPLFVTKTSL